MIGTGVGPGRPRGPGDEASRRAQIGGVHRGYASDMHEVMKLLSN